MEIPLDVDVPPKADTDQHTTQDLREDAREGPTFGGRRALEQPEASSRKAKLHRRRARKGVAG